MAADAFSEKIDLLVYGPHRSIVDNGFTDQFVLHHFEKQADLERLAPAIADKIRGMAITDSMPSGSAVQARFPKLEIMSSFGVGYDHIDTSHAREHNIVVTNTPDVLTEEVADVCTRPPDRDAARIRQGGSLCSGGIVDHAEFSLERRLAARPQGRHGRHGPNRSGDRATP